MKRVAATKGWEECIKEKAEILGSVVGNRALAKTELDRIEKFDQRCNLVDHFNLGRVRAVELKRALAMPMLSFE